MTLTPPRIGDMAAQCRAQRRLDKKSPDETNAARWNIARLLDETPEKVRCVRGGHDGTAIRETLRRCHPRERAEEKAES